MESNMLRFFLAATWLFLLIGFSLRSAEVYALKKRVAVISDLNGSYGSLTYGSEVHNAIHAIRDQIRPDVVIATGDLVAGQKKGLDYPGMWDGFHNAVTRPLQYSSIPFAPAPGNHDASAYSRFSQERKEYIRQWNLHKPDLNFIDSSNYPLYYSYIVGEVTFISIDATTIGKLSETQLRWIEQQLSMANPGTSKVVYGHIPLFPTGVGRETEVIVHHEFETILREHGAMYIGGHHHAYYPGYSNGILHLSMGCLGSGPRRLIGTNTRSRKSFTVIDIENGNVQSINAYHGERFQQVVYRKSLPEVIEFGSNLLIRDDNPVVLPYGKAQSDTN
jgi:acid phosphatase type 7